MLRGKMKNLPFLHCTSLCNQTPQTRYFQALNQYELIYCDVKLQGKKEENP